jgi:hypothetical protein
MQLRMEIDSHADTLPATRPASTAPATPGAEPPGHVPSQSTSDSTATRPGGTAPGVVESVKEIASDVPSGAIVVNATDFQRAEIVRRYRLFSYQPDEFITFAALAKMRPAQFDLDPRLYQYGGLWVYPVGMLLKVASVVGYVDLRGGGGGLSHYLDNPAAFGRFYIVARLYCAMWGLIGVAAVFAIVRRITASDIAGFAAGLLFCTMPVVVNAAHEAKPHLPGLSLTLLAVLVAAAYVESGKLRHAIAAGVLCGLALGMVLSALPVFVLLPLMVLLRPMTWGDRARVTIFAGLVGLVSYAVTNPYVAIHLLRGGGALQSNLDNSKAFYHVHDVLGGVVNVGRLIVVGTSPALAAVGLLGTIVLGIRAIRTRRDMSVATVRRRAHGLLLAGPAVLTAIQWALVGSGKPGEFGRFLLTTDVFLVVEAVVLLHLFYEWMHARSQREPEAQPPSWRRPAIVVLYGVVLAQTAWIGGQYVAGFVRDSGPVTTRTQAAEHIEQLRRTGVDQVVLSAEPAPYAIPPMNLWDFRMVVPPKQTTPAEIAASGELLVEPLEGTTPISWADKPISVKLAASADGAHRATTLPAPPGAIPRQIPSTRP